MQILVQVVKIWRQICLVSSFHSGRRAAGTLESDSAFESCGRFVVTLRRWCGDCGREDLGRGLGEEGEPALEVVGVEVGHRAPL
jgi:hypothetical protein